MVIALKGIFIINNLFNIVGKQVIELY